MLPTTVPRKRPLHHMIPAIDHNRPQIALGPMWAMEDLAEKREFNTNKQGISFELSFCRVEYEQEQVTFETVQHDLIFDSSVHISVEHRRSNKHASNHGHQRKQRPRYRALCDLIVHPLVKIEGFQPHHSGCSGFLHETWDIFQGSFPFPGCRYPCCNP